MVLNRLSDFLFVAARLVHDQDRATVLWVARAAAARSAPFGQNKVASGQRFLLGVLPGFVEIDERPVIAGRKMMS